MAIRTGGRRWNRQSGFYKRDVSRVVKWGAFSLEDSGVDTYMYPWVPWVMEKDRICIADRSRNRNKNGYATCCIWERRETREGTSKVRDRCTARTSIASNKAFKALYSLPSTAGSIPLFLPGKPPLLVLESFLVEKILKKGKYHALAKANQTRCEETRLVTRWWRVGKC
jgi:hypothetical protein